MFAAGFWLESAPFRWRSYMVGFLVFERVSQEDTEAEDGPGLDDIAAVVERVTALREHSGHHWIVTCHSARDLRSSLDCYRVNCDFIDAAKRRVSFSVR